MNKSVIYKRALGINKLSFTENILRREMKTYKIYTQNVHSNIIHTAKKIKQFKCLLTDE